MDKKQVIVTIAGRAGAGKTTICRIIEEALKEANVIYWFNDEDEYQFSERNQINGKRSLEQAIEIASDHVEVVLQERQLNRSAVNI
jgi:uridine kinase